MYQYHQNHSDKQQGLDFIDFVENVFDVFWSSWLARRKIISKITCKNTVLPNIFSDLFVVEPSFQAYIFDAS